MRIFSIFCLSIVLCFGLIANSAFAINGENEGCVEKCKAMFETGAPHSSCYGLCVSTCNVCQEKGNSGKIPPACENLLEKYEERCNICVDLTVNLTTDLFPGETSWTLTDLDTGDVIDSVDQGDLTTAFTTYTNTNCVSPNHCYEFEINDSFGDGICCVWGDGSYVIDLNGEIAASGGEFLSSETVQVGNCP